MRQYFCIIRGLILVILITHTQPAQAENPVVEWTRQLGTANFEKGMSVSVDTNGNVYVAGYTDGSLEGNTNVGGMDMFLTKYDNDGVKLWIQQLGTASNDYGVGVSVDANGNAYVAGSTESDLDGNTSAGGVDMFLTKYDEEGIKLWTKQMGSPSSEYSYDVSVDGSGNTYITGYTGGDLDGNTNAGGKDTFLIKYDTTGAKLWTRQLGSDTDDLGFSVSVDISGNVYMTGYTRGDLDGNTNVGNSDILLAKYNPDGVKLWTQQLGTANFEVGRSVSIDSWGNAYVAGYTGGDLDGNTNVGNSDIFLTKYNPDGIKLWTQQLGTAKDDLGLGVSVDGSGNAYVTGYTTSNLDGNICMDSPDMFLAKYNPDGVKLWTQQLGTSDYESGMGVSVDDKGKVYVTGYTYGGFDGNINEGVGDMFLMKISNPKSGDANFDGLVDVIDLGILATHYGTTSGAKWGNGDFTGEGIVDVCDLGILATHYGETASTSPQAVPEPGTLTLLAIPGLMLLGLGARQRN